MEKCNVLVVGAGGREFAIAKKLANSPQIGQVYCAPGNVGMLTIGVQPVKIEEDDHSSLIQFAKDNNIIWTFVGPEDCLVAGIVDRFTRAGLKIFGPTARAAQLEGSKSYALEFMHDYGIPTARYRSYQEPAMAIKGLEEFGFPVVIKEDGLAGGKGVIIAQNHDQAVQTIHDMFKHDQSQLLLEECLVGPEYSLFLVVSDNDYRILPLAQDHKRALDGDRGLNTGGMGAYSPVPQLRDADYQQMVKEVVEPTIAGLKDRNYHYHGILYIGLILTVNGPKVIEYNVRLGDPETQVILPRLETDFYELIDQAINDRPLLPIRVSTVASLGVVVAAKGYPQFPVQGQVIGELPQEPGIVIDYANVAGTLDHLTGAGGRLLMVLARGNTLQEAHDQVYGYLNKINLVDCIYRHDIGAKAGLTN